MLQGLQPTDHGLDTRAHLFVLVHQRGAFAGEGLVARAQRAILVLQMLDDRNQLLDPFREPRELQIELCSCGVAHVGDYRAALFAGSII
jgi:hypothetical protein